MPRTLTATIVLVLVLGVAGCGGKDKPASTTAQVATTPAAAATTPPTATSDATPSKSKTTGSKPSTGSRTSTTAKKSTAPAKTTSTTAAPGKTTTTPKKARPATTTPKAPVGVTPATGTGASGGTDLSNGTGSGSATERLQIVSVLKRYYRAFIDGDGDTVCSLLTSGGRDIMVQDGGAKTCAASVPKLVKKAGSDNIALLERTRAGLHINDIALTGNNAIAQIGKTSQLRLVQENGNWLLRSPNVINGS